MMPCFKRYTREDKVIQRNEVIKMNMSLGESYIAALDAFFPLDDAGLPMWDLVYAHRINITNEADGDAAEDTREEAAATPAPQLMVA
jgi:hypothetical protein